MKAWAIGVTLLGGDTYCSLHIHSLHIHNSYNATVSLIKIDVNQPRRKRTITKTVLKYVVLLELLLYRSSCLRLRIATHSSSYATSKHELKLLHTGGSRCQKQCGRPENLNYNMHNAHICSMVSLYYALICHWCHFTAEGY